MDGIARDLELYSVKTQIFTWSRDRVHFAAMALKLVADKLEGRDCSCAIAVRDLADKLDM